MAKIRGGIEEDDMTRRLFMQCISDGAIDRFSTSRLIDYYLNEIEFFALKWPQQNEIVFKYLKPSYVQFPVNYA